MKKLFTVVILTLFFLDDHAQDIGKTLAARFRDFEKDAQLQHASISLYVINAKTGQVVFDKNAQTGLAPASTQKIITSVTAFELLGKDFRYKTTFGIITNNNKRSLLINPSGDPTLGSWRWESTNEKGLLDRVAKAIRNSGATGLQQVLVNESGWDNERISDGWIWQDIGNYYGAGAGALNWRENQYDLLLKSCNKIGDSVVIVGTDPTLYGALPVSKLVSAAGGSGDNAYIYYRAGAEAPVVRGTIPVNENRFKISGAMVNAPAELAASLVSIAKENFSQPATATIYYQPSAGDVKIIHTELSPSLDSIIYWFNKKSINLYGEALLKTIGYTRGKEGSAEKGVSAIKDFWKQQGLDPDELNIRDGSGLSPLDRVTTHAQVTILKYATTRDWYPAFYNALPEYNGMKMKSGTINGVKGFCGYQRSKNGNEYIFSFLVNNYTGPAAGVVGKMYKVLDELK